MTQIETHEKAIKILENIDRLDYRIWSNSKSAVNPIVVDKIHYLERVKIDTAIREKLIKYYNKLNFKL